MQDGLYEHVALAMTVAMVCCKAPVGMPYVYIFMWLMLPTATQAMDLPDNGVTLLSSNIWPESLSSKTVKFLEVMERKSANQPRRLNECGAGQYVRTIKHR